MIELFTKITLQTVSIFSLLGIISGIMYYSTLLTRSRLLILLSSKGRQVLFKGKLRDLIMFSKTIKLKPEIKFCDSICSFFVLTFGVLFVFVNYVFLDGIVRIYTILFWSLGVYLSNKIVKSKLYSFIFISISRIIEILFLALIHLLKLPCCIITKKYLKKYSIPTI